MLVQFRLKSPCLVLPLLAALSACATPPRAPEAGEGLSACGSFPNCVSSADGGNAGVEALAATPAQWQALNAWLAEQPDWQVEIVKENFLQAVAITETMRYRDDVQLQYDPSAQLIGVRSSSRLGIGDMGANRARVENLRALISTL